MQLLKLGGSVITDKSKPFTAKTEDVDRLSEEIASTGSELNVLVHGGGSYGHTVAEANRIAGGFNSAEQLPGFSRTHQAMLTLNHIIVESMIDASVHAFGLSPSSFIITENGKIMNTDLSIVKSYIELGMVPVLFGDAVLDHKMGFTILSGDQLIVSIAKYLKADRIIMGCDVDGIFTSDPKMGGDAELIEVLNVRDLEMAKLGKALNTDVTGGMMGKVREAVEAAKVGIEVVFVNACVKGRVRSALRREDVKGTILTR
jgi:isopentenyl phosphate kinase